MLCFFAMGFVDLVGIASNYIKEDLGLTDSMANLLPSLVFFWFLIFSVPTGMLMNKIGRKRTVLLSIIVTVLSLILPIFGNSYPLMLIAFSRVLPPVEMVSLSMPQSNNACRAFSTARIASASCRSML